MTQLYDGDYLAQKHGVIVVVTNYRLGALGFLVTDEITGQFGMLDQRMGLQWVHDNIAAFGGDPANVMLFGQSAGGTSTGTHLVSPKTPDNLFASYVWFVGCAVALSSLLFRGLLFLRARSSSVHCSAMPRMARLLRHFSTFSCINFV